MGSVYALTFILAGCSLMYELLIAQTLSLLAANTVTRYAVTVGLYLGAMGVGALAAPKLYGRSNHWQALARVELYLSVLGGASVLIIHAGHTLFAYFILQGAVTVGVALFFGASAAVILAIGFFSGLELPLLIRIGRERSSGQVTPRILAADYFGSLLAGALFPLVLVPRADLVQIGFLTAGVNLAAASFILTRIPASGRRLSGAVAVCACAVVLGVGILSHGAIQQYLLKRYYYYYEYFSRIRNFTLLNYLKSALPLPAVERYSSMYQKIDVVRLVSYGDPFTPLLVDTYSSKFLRDEAFPRRYALFLNGDYQLWTDFEEIYHEYFAHVPVILNRSVPERVLVLGAGDGLLVRELLKYPQIREITLVELDGRVVDLARNHPVIAYANRRSLDDERVRVVIGDAYPYVRQTSQTFDAVYVDFPDPKDFDLSKLYSREFFHFLKRRIAPGGFAVINAPGIGQFSPDEGGRYRMDSGNTWDIFCSTLTAAGFAGIEPYASVLETDNPRAIRVLSSALEKVESFDFTPADPGRESRMLTTKDDMIRQILTVYTNDLISAFVMVTPEVRAFDKTYADPGVPLSVLNELRFGLAFSLPFGRIYDRKKVNSVTRPRLPNTPFWWVRTPI